MNCRRVLCSLVGSAVWVCLWSGLPASATTTKSPATLFSRTFDVSKNKIRLTPAARWGLFRESDRITIQTTDSSSIRVLDIDGNVVYDGAPSSFTLTRGHYFVECNGDRSQFCVLPNDYAGASFLGTDADGGGDSALTVRLGQIQPNWVRVMEPAQWRTVQPRRGVWDWYTADRAVAANQGRQIILQAFVRPDWVGDAEFIPRFADYVKELARRYDGKVRAIEIWNEPWYEGPYENRLPGSDWQEMLQYYNSMLQTARSAIRSVSSSIDVIGPSWQNPYNFEYTGKLVELGGDSQLEAYSFHDYVMKSAPPDQDTVISADGTAILPRIDKRMVIHRSFIGNKTVLVDEVGLYGKSALGCPNGGYPEYVSGLTWQRGLTRSVKSVIMYRAAGVQAIIPHVFALYGYPTSNMEIYGWDCSPSGSASPRGPHPKTSAFLMSCYWLNNATFVDKRTPGGKVFLYAWRRPNNTSMVFAWTTEGQSMPLKPSPVLTATDIYGRSIQVSTLTEEPVLFYSNSSDTSAFLSTVVSALTTNYNLPPVVAPIANQSAKKGILLQIKVSATDDDSDPLTYSVSPLPAGASIDPVTGVFSWTPTAGQTGSNQMTFTVTDARGLSASTSTVITVLNELLDGLVSYWRLDDGAGAVAADVTGKNNGTLVNFNFSGTSGWADGKYGKALSFDGINDFVGLNTTNLNLPNNFTVAAWVNPRQFSGPAAIVAVRSWYAASGFRMCLSGNSLLIEGQTSTGWKYSWFSAKGIQNGVWTHVAIVYDKSTVKAYVNGVSQPPAFSSIVNWSGDLVMNTARPSFIGKDSNGHFNGLVDDVMIFNRTLNPTEIVALQQAVVPTTPSQPTGLTAVAMSSTQIALAWQHDGINTAGYQLKSAPASTGPWTAIARLPASSRTYTNSGLTASTTYFYKVRAFTAATPPVYSKVSASVSATTPAAATSFTGASSIPVASAVGLFSRSFDVSATKIQLSPSNRRGLFSESDQIEIQTTGNSSVRLLNLDGSILYEGAPTTLTLPRGHYFVETDGDRTQFAVLPDDYAGAPFLGVEADIGGDATYEQKLAQIQPRWLRFGEKDYRSALPPLADGTPDKFDTDRFTPVELSLFGQSALGMPNPTGLANLTSDPAIDWRRGMSRAIKYVVMNRAKNVRLLMPRALAMAATSDAAANNYEIYGWEFGERGPHPKTSAFLMACYWLKGATFVARRIINDKIFFYQWNAADGSSIVFVWCTEDNSATALPVTGMQKTDIFGQEIDGTALDEEPVLYHLSAGNFTAMLDAVAALIQP